MAISHNTRFATADAVDTADYFSSTEQPAQLQKTADEEFLPWERTLKKEKSPKWKL